MDKNINNFFSPLRFFIYGFLLFIPGFIFNIKLIFDNRPNEGKYTPLDLTLKNLEVPIMIGLYGGIILILFGIFRKNKTTNKGYFFFIPLLIIFVTTVLTISGFLKVPSVCDKRSPMYMEPFCVSYAYPWNISFWPTIIKGNSLK